jgi:para-aminobenzoate synthetase component 1
MNKYGAEREPFMFIIDFDMKSPEIHKLNSVPPGIKYHTPLLSNINSRQIYTKAVSLRKHPLPFSQYLEAFRNVQKNIRFGNSFLLNLTFPTLIETDLTLEEIFNVSVANYKLLYKDVFVVFSPEIFVRISDGEIISYPMKGTIDSSVPDAEKVLLADVKEEAEHNTIVDLIRNDLSKVADSVIVVRSRYLDSIKTGNSDLFQLSSQISGRLSNGYENNLGDIIAAMLPAGSVTGAPKKETLRIIKESESSERGWYTGIFGVFDGKALDSAVMIRFIEKKEDKFYFKSGGGITYLSDPEKEYKELISKVYVPVG